MNECESTSKVQANLELVYGATYHFLHDLNKWTTQPNEPPDQSGWEVYYFNYAVGELYPSDTEIETNNQAIQFGWNKRTNE